MSICPDPELYSAYIDDELSKLSKKELESHLSECESCRALINKYKDIRSLLVYDDEPELDIGMSFNRLVAKRNKTKLKLAVFLLSFLRTREKVFVLLAVFALAFILTVPILQGNTITNTTSYEGNEKSADFLPILPVSHVTKQKLNFKELKFHDIDMFLASNKKRNTKIYKNFINTFNNFSYLYSKLDEEESNFIDIKNPIMDNEHYTYTSNMQIYTNLNRHAK